MRYQKIFIFQHRAKYSNHQNIVVNDG